MSRKNYGYCRRGEDGIVYADAVINDGSTIFVNPTKGQYGANGWYEIVREYPECPEGKIAVENGSDEWTWDDGDMTVRVTYRLEDEPEPGPEPEPEPVPLPPRKFSKLKLYAVLARMGIWERLVEWMQSQSVDGVSVYTAFVLAQDLAEDDEMFAPYLAMAQAELGVDDETLESILASAEA